MEQIVKSRSDIAFYLKMFPIVQLHPEAYAKSKTIVCEEDNEKAIKLLEDVYAKKRIKAPECDTKVIDENIRLAAKLRITGTPTLIFPDGTKVSGAMDATKLLGLIQKHGG
jgi:thiol:disulfide interchange protein DsbC